MSEAPPSRGSAPASPRWTPCSAASTGATTSSGSSTATPIEPFYRAIAGQSGVFDVRIGVSLGRRRQHLRRPRPGHARRRRQRRHGVARRAAAGDPQRLPAAGPPLMLFESLDGMMRAWGVSGTREFFTRCCPLLLEVGAIAYWSMSVRETPAELREAVIAVTQCVLRVDERSVQVVKAEGARTTRSARCCTGTRTTGGRPSPRRRSSIASPPRCGRSAIRTSSASTTSATWPA